LDRTRETCAACGSSALQPVLWLDQQGRPHGLAGHAFTYSHIVIQHCPACGRGQIEKFDHDCFDYEQVWDQAEWYTLDPADMARVIALARLCPQPQQPDCECAVHIFLRADCQALPAKGWSHSLEAQQHIHRARLRTDQAVPHLELEDAPHA